MEARSLALPLLQPSRVACPLGVGPAQRLPGIRRLPGRASGLRSPGASRPEQLHDLRLCRGHVAVLGRRVACANRRRPGAAVAALRGLPSDSFPFAGPTWTGALRSLQACVSAYPGDGLMVANVLQPDDGDLRNAITHGWDTADLDEQASGDVLAAIDSWDRDEIRRAAAKMLSTAEPRRTRPRGTAIREPGKPQRTYGRPSRCPALSTRAETSSWKRSTIRPETSPSSGPRSCSGSGLRQVTHGTASRTNDVIGARLPVRVLVEPDHLPGTAPVEPFRVTNDVTPSPLTVATPCQLSGVADTRARHSPRYPPAALTPLAVTTASARGPMAAKPHLISHDVLAAGALLG